MFKKLLTQTIVISTLLLLAACGPSEEELAPVQENVPAPPTASEIQQGIMNAVQPVVSGMQQGAGLEPAQVEPNIKNLQSALGKFRGTPNYQEGSKNAAAQLKEYVRQADREQRVWYVVFFYEALAVVDRDSAKDVERLRQNAQLVIDRPKPDITGFWKDEATGQTTVFLHVTTPSDGKTHDVRAREGDEFYDLRLIEIIGDNKCVKFEYLVNQDTFQVCTDAARQSQ